MKYLNKTFSAPVAGPKVSQKQWDAIWAESDEEVPFYDYLVGYDSAGYPVKNKVKASRKSNTKSKS